MMNKILLRKTIYIRSSIAKLRNNLNSNQKKGFSIEWINEKEFKILANISVGTAIVSGFSGLIDGIKVYGNIKEIENKKCEITLKTKLRIEFYFLILFFIIFSIAYFFDKEGNIPFWVVFIIIHLFPIWFWIVYRIQEKSLIKKFSAEAAKINNLD